MPNREYAGGNQTSRRFPVAMPAGRGTRKPWSGFDRSLFMPSKVLRLMTKGCLQCPSQPFENTTRTNS